MAPVTANAVGVARQTVDDPDLASFLSALSRFEVSDGGKSGPPGGPAGAPETTPPPVDVDGLVAELGGRTEWRFQEQADLYEWIGPLNAIDAALTYLIESNPGLLLVGRESGILSKKPQDGGGGDTPPVSVARCMEDVSAVPASATSAVRTILRFLSDLLRNASNKIVFNSVDSLLLLLSAADDDASALALDALARLAAPPALHRQQAPEAQQHSTALHSAGAAAQEELLALARGWGSRGSGLGLHACVTLDDSQGSSMMPQHAGEVRFDFLPDGDAPRPSSVHLTRDEIVLPSDDGDDAPGGGPVRTRSTAELFFACLEGVPGGRARFPPGRLPGLLASVRLARSFHTRDGRAAAVGRRLRALAAALHVHPSQEVMAGYFQAQPELCGEVAELLRPAVSSPASSSLPAPAGGAAGTGATAPSPAAPVPHEVRVLAVEALTALVARRDGSNGGLSPVARHANVLGELGVGRGQYLGLLPTLVRHSLASLGAARHDEEGGGRLKRDPDEIDGGDDATMEEVDDADLDLGMAFVGATGPPPVPAGVREERHLEMVDAVLTLTSAVVSIPSGTAALTECGLIPALVGVVSLDRDHAPPSSPGDGDGAGGDDSHVRHLRRFVAAQAVQILEGAVVTHSSALGAFHELGGVDLLVARLHEEIELVKEGRGETAGGVSPDDGEMADDDAAAGRIGGGDGGTDGRPLCASRRVLMFSIVNCLTVVFHQQEANSSRSGGTQLRKQELTDALIDIMDNISSYGGVLASLTATLLSDVMNADPQVVHHVHSSGLAASFLTMMMGEKGEDSEDCDWRVPTLPPSSELIMALPNVLSALSLTEEGARAVGEANPFPALLAIFCSPQYAMPQSRCLLNDMTAIVGTGVDELMRHVPALRPLCVKALVGIVQRVVALGNRLIASEELRDGRRATNARNRSADGSSGAVSATALEDSRTCVMQYAFNVSQLLEQVLQNTDHATPFVEAGGFEALMDLHPLLVPCGERFLAHVSCLSNPSSANLTHYTTTNALTLTIRSLASHYETHKLIRKMVGALEVQLDKLGQRQKELRDFSTSKKVGVAGSDDQAEESVDVFSLFESDPDLNAVGILDDVPRVGLHMLQQDEAQLAVADALSAYLREVVTTEWLITVLAALIRTACQRSQEMNSIWGGAERDQGWKAELSSPSFAAVIRKLNNLHLSAQVEVCRVRSDETYESRERERRRPPGTENAWHPARYRLRIVCQDGAVVRDGTEIDSCASVGSLEMGEIVEAFDRCVNSSGVMRYRTSKGWISEHTRGHGREPIAEVLSVEGISQGASEDCESHGSTGRRKRIECGIPDLCSVSTSVLSRLQGCQKNLLSSLSRSVSHGIRSLHPAQRFSSQMGAYAGKVIHIVVENLRLGFDIGFKQTTSTRDVDAAVSKTSDILMKSFPLDNRRPSGYQLTPGGLSIYFGAALELLEACLYGFKPYEEKRERRTLNVPLLVSLLCGDGFYEGFDGKKKTDDIGDCELGSLNVDTLPAKGFLGAIRYVLNHSLSSFVEYAATEPTTGIRNEGERAVSAGNRLGRSVCASFPPTLSLMRRLTSRWQVMSSHNMCSFLGRMKRADLTELIGDVPLVQSGSDESPFFNPNQFCRGLHCVVSNIAREVWVDPRLVCAPPHVLHPIVSLVGEVLVTLEEGSKEVDADDSNGTARSTTGNNNSAGSGSQRGSDLQHRLSRGIPNLPAAMNIFFGGPAGSSRPVVAAPFEASEETVGRLVEMGFSRDHALEALESTESNRIEVAMEYALAHPPPSPGTIERRRVAREERRREREAREAGNETQGQSDGANASDAVASSGATGDEATAAEPAAATGQSDGDGTADGTGAADGIVGADPADGAGGDAGQSNDSSTSVAAGASATPVGEGEPMDCDGDNGVSATGASAEDDSKDSKPPAAAAKKVLSEAEKESARRREVERQSAEKAVMCLKAFRSELSKVAFDIIEGGSHSASAQQDTATSAIAAPPPENSYRRVFSVGDGSGVGDGEAEAVTVVMCQFLLDLCGRYPSDRSATVNELVQRLKSQLWVTENGSSCTVICGHEGAFASLCHASVIIFRALPRTKAVVLRFGLVSLLLQCIRNETSSSKHKGKRKSENDQLSLPGWPRWLSPALLLLDVMAQPTAAPVDCDDEEGDAGGAVNGKTGCGPKGEYTRMRLEHRKQEALLSKTAGDIFAAVNGKPVSRKKTAKGKSGNKKDEKTDGEKQGEKKDKTDPPSLKEDADSTKQPAASEQSVSFPSIPCYMPLMPSEEAEACMLVCLRILRYRPKKHGKESVPPPSVVHSTLLLLARVLRSHRIALQSLKMGVAELLLALPSQCYFAGNTGLVAVIMRHLLEDEATLRTAMETEIRGTVARLYRQHNRGSASSVERPKVSARAFVQAITPLICRDPVVFLKASATSVMVECSPNDASTSRASRLSRSGNSVVLLSSSERSKNLKAIAEAFSNSSHSSGGSLGNKGAGSVKRGRSQHSRGEHRGTKSKSPHHHQPISSASPKRSRKEKQERGGNVASPSGFIVLNGTPANHITCLLVTELIRSVDKEGIERQRKDNSSNVKVNSSSVSFLRTVDYLEILADLVLAVPACAAAIHRYRPSSANGSARKSINDLQHALHGCPPPPSTAVSYLLHSCLPQPRSAQFQASENTRVGWRNRGQLNDEHKLALDKKKAYMRVRVGQASARLLVALCARPGEGRRRVVADLCLALSGGRGKSAEKLANIGSCESEREMWALQAWGELCIGLAAPKSASVNQDGNSALSWEVVKLMLEHGVAHALMAGIQRVNLNHPLASSAAGALLRPMEVFTRRSVLDTVTEMFRKEASEKTDAEKKEDGGQEEKDSKAKRGSGRRAAPDLSQRSEVAFADDAMLEEGFDPDTADRARQNARRRDLRQMVEGMVHLDDDEEESDRSDSDDDLSGGESSEEDDAEEFSDQSSGDEAESSENSDEGEEFSSAGEESNAEGFNEDPASESSSSSSDESEHVDDADGEDMDVEEEEAEDDDSEEEDDDEAEDVEEDEEFDWENEDQDFFENSVGGDEGEEAGVPVEASELEEGWTRIDSGFGGAGMLLARQGASGESNANRHRAGIVVDAAEAVIGNILRGSNIQMEALAEIEDTLGIRISHRGDFEPPRGGRGGGFAGMVGVSSASGANADSDTAGASSAGGQGLSIRNRGTVGSFPGVQQRRLEESGHLANFSGRWNEMSAVDYAFGDASIAAEYDDNASQTSAGEQGDFPVPDVFDTQLFPGGPAAATHARTQQYLHSLLCDVELPAVNAMSSNLRAHESRYNLRGRAAVPGESSSAGGNLFPGSGTNLLRLNRGADGVPFLEQTSRQVGGSSGGFEARWTDDGQALDGTTADFTLAFENALGETIARNIEADDESQANEPQANDSQANADASTSNGAASLAGAGESHATNRSSLPGGNNNEDGHGDGGEVAVADSSPVNREEQHENSSTRAQGVEASGDVDADSVEQGPPNAAASGQTAADAGAPSNEGNSSEGEGVANSLASGLNLSPRSESSTASLEEATSDPAQAAEATSATDGAAADGTNPGVAAESMDVDETTNAESAAEMGGGGDEQDQAPGGGDEQVQAASSTGEEGTATGSTVPESEHAAPNENGFVCPPGMDLDVFNQLPADMQQEVVEQHRATVGVAEQLDAASGLDPEALAALPEDMRREVIAQEQQERLQRQQAPADPSNAEEMDNASFVASLAPELREEILLTADDAFLGSLPPDIIAEAQILRERASSQHRRLREESFAPSGSGGRETGGPVGRSSGSNPSGGTNNQSGSSSGRRRGERSRNGTGKVKVDSDHAHILLEPSRVAREYGTLIPASSMKSLVRLMYLLSPVRPQRLLQKLLQNLCADAEARRSFLTTFVALLGGDCDGALLCVNKMDESALVAVAKDDKNDKDMAAQATVGTMETDDDDFPPSILIGTAPDVLDSDFFNPQVGMFRRRQGNTAAAAIAANLPGSARGLSDESLPPVVARRIIDTLLFLSKNSPRVSLEMLTPDVDKLDGSLKMSVDAESCLDRLLDLIGTSLYSKSSNNLEQLLNLIENVVALLSSLPKDGEATHTIGKTELEAAAASGKEWISVPRPVVAQSRLRSLCSVLRLESCKESCFQKVNTIARRLCRVEANREKFLLELAGVAQGLGANAIRDLKLLRIQLNDASKVQKRREETTLVDKPTKDESRGHIPSSAVTLSTSSSELKLLRVLQTLHVLCGDPNEENGRKNDGQTTVTPELVTLLHSVELESLWDELSACLRVVSVLEGVTHEDEEEKKEDGDGGSAADEDDLDAEGSGGKKLQSSVAGLVTRFLPTIEAFFVVNASSTKGSDVEAGDTSKQDGVEAKGEGDKIVTARNKVPDAEKELDNLVGGTRLVTFVASNKVLLNALLRSNPSLLDKGLRAMVNVPQCRPFMDFDVKRQWFKSQVRRLRQHASRRHGSLRLNIRRKHVFEDAYHQLRLRNAEEMRGRLHITFRNEEGVDAGGLSREFFGILAKEMFNPNYALFTSTEDGCTFQPNPNSSINPDHLHYFRFVGRIVGKAVVDGFLLDAHFTRSLYKHMLGSKPTHHDMQAIDPDYYKNLQMILEYNLNDIGLDLTFSAEDHSFGRSQTIDLIPNGRSIAVTEENKAKYVSLVCQHRMTTAIELQIKAYLEGFYELVKPELISIFTAKELELLISGMPDIDMHDLQNNTEYHNYKPSDPQIIWFWNIMFSLSKSEKAAFVQFVTGSSKVPLEGFSHLLGMRGLQKFSIHRIGGSSSALVSAHTCFNALDMPVYKSEDEMREKILYAINEGATGFLFA